MNVWIIPQKYISLLFRYLNQGLSCEPTDPSAVRKTKPVYGISHFLPMSPNPTITHKKKCGLIPFQTSLCNMYTVHTVPILFPLNFLSCVSLFSFLLSNFYYLLHVFTSKSNFFPSEVLWFIF